MEITNDGDGSHSDDDDLLFLPELQAERSAPCPGEGPWHVLIVDDDRAMHQATRFALGDFRFADRPLQFHSAYSAAEARALLPGGQAFACAMVDVVMENPASGLQLVEYIRHELKNEEIRIILRTGQPGYAPEAAVIQAYDINDYRDKAQTTVTHLYTSMAAALRSYRQITSLARVVDERTAQLRLEKERADHASEAKTQFLAHMSHEIRTPMNAIIGLSRLVGGTELSPHQRDYIDKIQQASQHLLGILNDVLDFSKAEAGMLVLEKLPFMPDELLRGVGNVIAEKAQSKGLELIISVDSEVPRQLVGDSLRLSQILINYANNAIKFTDHGEVSIAVRLEAAPEAEAEVPSNMSRRVLLRFEVSDTGVGLSDEQIGRLFQRFSQASDSTSRLYGGTGLGLAISKGLAELMGGGVGVRSQPGLGSTFWFTAQLDVGQADAVPRRYDRGFRGRRALVVDDNLHATIVLREMLEPMGLDVSVVYDGQQAVERVREAAAAGTAFDVVLLDWQMPGMDGLETARIIRELGLARTPAMALVTAYAREESLKAAGAAGIDEVLLKPVGGALLFDLMARLLGGHARQAEQQRQSERAGGLEAPAALRALRGARILLVEDNELNQQIATELLQRAGFVVDAALHGKMALEMLQVQHYDIVLMDMRMPVMDGITATRHIRAQERHASLPIVAMTANVMVEDHDRCFSAGMNAVITKPIDPAALWAALLQWVRPRPGLGESAQAATAAATPDEPRSPLPRAVPGLDTVRGLQRFGGKQEIYLKILRMFVATHRGTMTEIDQALAAGDHAAAERLVETLGSTAASVGAGELQQLLEPLEAALREHHPAEKLQQWMAPARIGLDALVVALEQALDGS